MNPDNHSRLGETALQAKIRESLKRHKPKPYTAIIGKHKAKVRRPGVMNSYKAVAAEVGCSIGAVQAVENVDRAGKEGQKLREQALEPLQFDKPVKTRAENPLIRALQPFDSRPMSAPDASDFPGWVVSFGKLSLMINSYLQIARVTGASMQGCFLEQLRDLCEKAQVRADEDQRLRKMWPDGAPAGSGNFRTED